MSATIETTNKVLAAMIAQRNPGATATEDGGVWTVSHADELVITAHIAQRAGYEVSHPESKGPNTFSDSGSSTIADIMAEGYVWLWTAHRIVIKSGGEADASYQGTLEPTSAGVLTTAQQLSRARGGSISH